MTSMLNLFSSHKLDENRLFLAQGGTGDRYRSGEEKEDAVQKSDIPSCCGNSTNYMYNNMDVSGGARGDNPSKDSPERSGTSPPGRNLNGNNPMMEEGITEEEHEDQDSEAQKKTWKPTSPKRGSPLQIAGGVAMKPTKVSVVTKQTKGSGGGGEGDGGNDGGPGTGLLTAPAEDSDMEIQNGPMNSGGYGEEESEEGEDDYRDSFNQSPVLSVGKGNLQLLLTEVRSHNMKFLLSLNIDTSD